ncbi:hypothetical protein M5U04_20285 [Xenorhabdus sp. XENO-1]|uniref:hypothetical protein n=1 Tax=Xenorhabdus bovienii TaxID=40576 RepID=UPI0020CA43AA|nr:hypothetical protein [Xenorhabdus bovienii]MCP9270345.1 hypothetical protein [Xenorhabdus bovienii subsp. africana]
MTQSTLLERKRKAFIHAKLDVLKRKYGSYSEIVEVADFDYRLDLDEEILTLALIKFFENELDEHQHKLHELINTYDSFYNKFGNLTPEGNEFMNEILKRIAIKTEPMNEK